MMSFYNRYFKEKLEPNFSVTIVFGDRLIWRPFVTEKKLNFSLILDSYIELMKATFPKFSRNSFVTPLFPGRLLFFHKLCNFNKPRGIF